MAGLSDYANNGDLNDPGDIGRSLYNYSRHYNPCRDRKWTDRCRRDVASHRLPVTTALFLFTTALTSVTGFLFPIHGFTPALGVGVVACVILAVALFALYKEHLAGV